MSIKVASLEWARLHRRRLMLALVQRCSRVLARQLRRRLRLLLVHLVEQRLAALLELLAEPPAQLAVLVVERVQGPAVRDLRVALLSRWASTRGYLSRSSLAF